MCVIISCLFFFFKQKTAYEMRISDWSSDVCSSDLDEARLDQRGADGQVVLCGADHLVDRARRMADLQPEVPQGIELRLDHLFGPARVLERGDGTDVEVAVRRHLDAAVAADREHRDPV